MTATVVRRAQHRVASSQTSSEKVNGVSAFTCGAVNVGVAVFAPVSVTVGPPVWVQA